MPTPTNIYQWTLNNDNLVFNLDSVSANPTCIDPGQLAIWNRVLEVNQSHSLTLCIQQEPQSLSMQDKNWIADEITFAMNFSARMRLENAGFRRRWNQIECREGNRNLKFHLIRDRWLTHAWLIFIIYLLIKIKIHNTKNARHCVTAAFIYIAYHAYRITPFTHRVQLNYRNMHMCDQKLHLGCVWMCIKRRRRRRQTPTKMTKIRICVWMRCWRWLQ